MHVIPNAGCNPFSVFFGCFWFWLFVLVCVFCFLGCFVFDGIAHWTVYWSTTSSFEAADLFDGLASKLQFSFAAAVERGNDLAKAMKALDGKKITTTSSQSLADTGEAYCVTKSNRASKK